MYKEESMYSHICKPHQFHDQRNLKIDSNVISQYKGIYLYGWVKGVLRSHNTRGIIRPLTRGLWTEWSLCKSHNLHD